MTIISRLNVSNALLAFNTNPNMAAIIIGDSSDNIAININALSPLIAAGKIASIFQTDPTAPVKLNITELTNNTDVLNKISTRYSLALTDTGTNVVQNIDGLQSIVRKIASINISNPTIPLAISATQLTANQTLISKIISIYTLNVSAVPTSKLGIISANGHIGSVTILDSALNINKKASLYLLSILGSKVSTITQTGSITPITLTVSQYSSALTSKFTNFTAKISDASTALMASLLTDEKISSLIIKDTSGNIATNIDALQALDGKVTAINQIGTITPLNLTANQLINDAGTLNKIVGRYNLIVSAVPIAQTSAILTNIHVKSFSIIDNATNINNPTQLSALITAGNKIASITESGTITPINLSITQYTKIFANKLTNFSVAITDAPTRLIRTLSVDTKISSISVSDSAKNISYNLDFLQSLGSKLSSITLTGAPNTLAITQAQLTNDAVTLAKVLGDYTLKISGVPVTDILTVLNNSHVVSFSIADTASNIATHLDNLQNNASIISRIVLTDSPGTLTITETQLNRDTTALALITSNGSATINGLVLIDNSYTLIVTNVLAADISNVLSTPFIKSISITDTAANIASNIDLIKSNLALINTVTITDATQALTMTEAQFINNGSLSALISGNYSVVVTDVTLGNLAIVLANPFVASISISDTLSHILLQLTNLQENISKITAITLTDAPTNITVSYAQLINDSDVLALVSNTYPLLVTDVPVAEISNVLAITGVISLTVKDTAAHINASLDTLQAVSALNHVTGITLSNSPQLLAISYSQLSNDADALALINLSSYTLTISDVAVINMTTVLENPLVKNISINDNFTNIINNLNVLEANKTLINNITFSDAPTNLAITPEQLAFDTNMLNLISSVYPNLVFNVDLPTPIATPAINVDGANGHINFILHPQSTNTPSDTNFGIVNHFNGQDTLTFVSTIAIDLSTDGNLSPASLGMAQIDLTSGIATFDPLDDTLALQITAAESALSQTASTLGNVAFWQNGTDSYVFISDATSGVSAGDNLIQLTGIDVSHLHLVNGAIVYS
ncbi:MAG: hypothetical protein NTY69_09425 [Methylococcales bacterium]|nr:hypothetical protein [Methylococcales bacterium]